LAVVEGKCAKGNRKHEAKLKNLPPEGFKGGLIIDEMSIQPDLQFKKTNGEIELIGFTEVLPESLAFDEIKTNRRERILATHVLQLVFLGTTGFRFPFAHFPSWFTWFLYLCSNFSEGKIKNLLFLKSV
jgi:hypothetical protein